MKIKLPKDYKKWMTVERYEEAKAIINDYSEPTSYFEDYAQTAARIASRNNGVFEILKLSAEIAGHDDNNGYFDHNLDIYLEFYAFDSFCGFYEIGAYLSDIWQATGENSDELRAKMYIREYTRKA